ncbi:phosphate ABC transporter substrate-binding protein [Methylomarinum sp. Ch1-1]|uniref:Phosphate ABC transporter substrate-binding protein n=1 Tax=Methylomarinum roseum TaxID=3067653 RepID=A0AAU7NZI1_9GAMM|nr:phosphate ABC transporter substrate-binding protein [Methylomarinum sp. Ch1-1]MDP4521459.1 phosphate ABC transporter substrate-binding protein [Methylomarinum sp. Ch1-1]
MKKLILVVLTLIMIITAWSYLKIEGIHFDNEADIEKLILTGSSTVAPLAAEIGKRFESLNPNVRVDVQTGGSSRGVNDARAGLADIGMASRALKDSEADLHSYTIALDGISIIVNEANPVTSLTQQQIIDIYTGEITNWKAVGGNDRPITVVNKAEGHSTLELFLHHFGLQNTQVKPHVVIGDNQQGIKTVAGNPDAIGYVSVGSAEYEASHGVSIKLLPLQNIAASVKNLRNRTFPLSRPLNLVTKNEPSGMIKTFIEFARSEQVNDIIAAQYFVPVAP